MEKLVDEDRFEQTHEIQENDVKFAIVGKEIDKPATIQPFAKYISASYTNYSTG